MLYVHLLPPGLPQLQIPAVHQQDEVDVFTVIALPSIEVWHGSVSGSRSAPPIGVCSSIMSEKSQKFTHRDLLTIVLASVSALNLPGPAFSCPVYVSYHKNCQMPRSAPRLRLKGLYIPNPTPFSTFLQFLNLSCPLKLMVHQNCLSTFFFPGCPHQLLATTEMWIAPESSFACSLLKCCLSSHTPCCHWA